jgi:hypothetical protein
MFLVIERVITNIGNYKQLARIFKLHKRFHGATEPIRNATGGILRTESHIFCSHIFLTVVHPKLNNNVIKLVICMPQVKIRDSRNPQISAPLWHQYGSLRDLTLPKADPADCLSHSCTTTSSNHACFKPYLNKKHC